MKKLFFLFFIIVLFTVQVFAIVDPQISEIRTDQTGTDFDEYFELSGVPGLPLTGLTYLVIGDGTGGSGVIENVTDLSGQSIQANGYFVAAEATFTLGTANLTTTLNFENSDNVTHLLVEGFTGSNGDDLDTNDDGVFDATPWSYIVDKIALVEEANPPSGTEYHYGPPSIGPDGSFVPGHVFRRSLDGAWMIGQFDISGGDDTPGGDKPQISEIRTDQTGTDNDEYFELSGVPGLPLTGLTYLVIGDGTGGSGVIENVTALSGILDANGYFVAAEATFSLGSPDMVATLNFENSDNVTHLLVEGFTGSNGDDLDTNDDGVFDATPWSYIVDKIALVEEANPPSGTEYHYGPPSIGPDGSFVPGHVFRRSLDGAWMIGQFDISGGDDTPGGDNPLPVELSSFTVEATDQGVLCEWTTESEIENLGFVLERKTEGTDWEEIVSYKSDRNLMGQGTISSPTDYEYLDKLVEPNTTYDYRLADVDLNGAVTYHSTRTVTVEQAALTSMVEEFTVLPAYPNPFNPSTTIKYVLGNDSKVTVAIYDIAGNLITTLVNTEQTQGWHSVIWNGTNQLGEQAPAGQYLSRVISDNEVKTTKLLLLK